MDVSLSYVSINWTLRERIEFQTSILNSLSSVYIYFVDSNSNVYTPQIVNQTNGGAIMECLTNLAETDQSISVNDFIDFTSYQQVNNGPLTLIICQLGERPNPFVDIGVNIQNFAFTANCSIITTNSGAPVDVTSNSGPYYPP
jgi:hypothetical protein